MKLRKEKAPKKPEVPQKESVDPKPKRELPKNGIASHSKFDKFKKGEK